jgi:hypothetical protein
VRRKEPIVPDPDARLYSGEGEVAVVLDSQGKPQNVALRKSTGVNELNAAMSTAAVESRYTAKVVNCKPVDGGEYLSRELYRAPRSRTIERRHTNGMVVRIAERFGDELRPSTADERIAVADRDHAGYLDGP